MTHLFVSRHYPPAPGGGIGTYLGHIVQLLVERGETVHVIGRQHGPATDAVEELHGRRLVIHRLPTLRRGWTRTYRRNLDSLGDELHHIGSGALHFAWEASHYAERLIERESVDVIEVQDYQAPLYFFQLRRALGLGPQHLPPIIVHLHSPTEMIVEEEDVDVSRSELSRMRRLERFAVATADTLLAPSKYQAQQIAANFAFGSQIEVIPLPIGAMSRLERSRDVWKDGSICFVGRLEPRKGVSEWITAAIEVAKDHPHARFEFIGRDDRPTVLGITAREAALREIPEEMHSRFRFFGNQPQEHLYQLLGRARAVVVPSRWESFSYVCAEALASGVPVLATPVGAMPDMITHGETGWLAQECTPAELARLLREILTTSPQQLAEMGGRAATSIKAFCVPERILEKHLDLRNRVVKAGAICSARLPRHLNWLTSRASPPNLPRLAEPGAGRSVIRTELRGDQSWPSKAELAARAPGQGDPPLGVIFLNAADRTGNRLEVECERVLRERPEVGIVSCWARENGHVRFSLPPAFPIQWVDNEARFGSCIRWEALDGVPFCQLLDETYSFWNVVNHVLAAGWTAVTIPEVLIEREIDLPRIASGSVSHSFMMQRLLEPHASLLAPDAIEVIADLVTDGAQRKPSVHGQDGRWHRVRSVIDKLAGKS